MSLEDQKRRIRNLREMMDWSQATLAKYFDVTAATVNRWESGFNKMSGSAIKVLESLERKASAFHEKE